MPREDVIWTDSGDLLTADGYLLCATNPGGVVFSDGRYPCHIGQVQPVGPFQMPEELAVRRSAREPTPPVVDANTPSDQYASVLTELIADPSEQGKLLPRGADLPELVLEGERPG